MTLKVFGMVILSGEPPTSASHGRLRVYANVSCPAAQRARRVWGKAIGSGKTRSRPKAEM